MPAGHSVRPQKWGTDVIDLFDNGDYSAIWGTYENSATRRLGVRWNGDPGNQGFPNQGGHPTWFVEPNFLTRMILLDFCGQVVKNNAVGNLNNILTALNEC
ncbi:MAG: hypothetical protein Ta2B_30680 [Termitinemataceae bacterium]|nr:MAG: hypothetical protein Ta2B_30680 [Termitinemataceae bacterium]